MRSRNIRLLIVDPIEINASLWKRMLEQEGSIAEVACVNSLQRARELAESFDVVLLGTSIPLTDSLTFVQHAATSVPDSRSIVSGVPRSEQALLRTVEAGASGVLFRDETVEAAMETIRAVCSGNSRVDPEFAPALMEHLKRLHRSSLDPDTQGRRYDELTDREREVLDLVARRLSNKDIARSLSIKVGTVKNHVHRILDKLETGNRHLAAQYLRSLNNTMTTSPERGNGRRT